MLSIDAPHRIGIDYEALSRRNPGLIYAHASGWGRRGSDAETLSFDYTGLARSGTMMMCGEEGDPPKPPVPGFGDQMGAIHVRFRRVCRPLRPKPDRQGATGRYFVTGLDDMPGDFSPIGTVRNRSGVSSPSADKAGNPMYNH